VGGCGPDFEQVAAGLGGLDCAHAAPVVSVRSPLGLDNWTMPVLEVVMILGALAALGHAVRRWRRTGDPTGPGLWAATVVQVLVLEPPLYFPDRFGLQDQVGLIFVHNQFSVQFLNDRLPLYIVALYPALTYLAYVLARGTGILDRENAVVGAAVVAFVFHCLYEIFDGLGPQLHWWAWNPAAPDNSPWLASVPLTSAVMFAGASPFGLALATRLLLARRAARGRIRLGSLVLRVIAVGLSGILAMLVFAVPYGLLGEPGAHLGARSVLLWAEIGSLAAVSLRALGRSGRGGRGGRIPEEERGGYPVVAGTAYLLVLGGLWGSALPDYLAAESGRTSSGAPTGSLGYAVLCAVLAVGVIVLALPKRSASRLGPSPVKGVRNRFRSELHRAGWRSLGKEPKDRSAEGGGDGRIGECRPQ
jgi:hypothetical protein